jgi:hypothetical protein
LRPKVEWLTFASMKWRKVILWGHAYFLVIIGPGYSVPYRVTVTVL